MVSQCTVIKSSTLRNITSDLILTAEQNYGLRIFDLKRARLGCGRIQFRITGRYSRLTSSFQDWRVALRERWNGITPSSDLLSTYLSTSYHLGALSKLIGYLNIPAEVKSVDRYQNRNWSKLVRVSERTRDFHRIEATSLHFEMSSTVFI